MVMLRSTNPDLYDQSMSKVFFKDLAKKAELYSRFFNILMTENKQEVFSEISGLGLLSTKTEGAAYSADELLQLYDKTFTPTTVAGLVEATKEAVADDRSGRLEQIPKMLGVSMYATIETAGANILDRSQTDTGADAKVLGATDHPLNPNTTTTWSNRPDTNTDLTVEALENAVSALWSTPNARNIPDGLTPKILVIHPNNKVNADKIFQSQHRPFELSNTENVVNQYGIQIVVNPFLTDTDAWHLLTDKSEHQLFCLKRQMPQFKTDTDTRTDNTFYKANARFIFGWASARGYYGSVGA